MKDKKPSIRFKQLWRRMSKRASPLKVFAILCQTEGTAEERDLAVRWLENKAS